MPLKSIALAACAAMPLLLCACSDDPAPPPQDSRVVDFNKADGAAAGGAGDAPDNRDGNGQQPAQQPNSN